eukprot:1127229-Pyramimonas_sp.AAC.1
MEGCQALRKLHHQPQTPQAIFPESADRGTGAPEGTNLGQTQHRQPSRLLATRGSRRRILQRAAWNVNH